MALTLLDAPPSFLGGVSQQDSVHRLPSQCEAQENFWASPVDGLRPRHPTDHMARLWGSESQTAHGGPFFLHPIDRGTGERYTIAVASGQILATDAETGEVIQVLAPNSGTVVLNTVPAFGGGTDPYVEVDAEPSGAPKRFIFKLGGGVDADPLYYVDTTVYNTTTLALNRLAVKIRAAFGAGSVEAYVSNGVLTAYDVAPPNYLNNPPFLVKAGGDSATSITVDWSNLARLRYLEAPAAKAIPLLTPDDLFDNQDTTQEAPNAGAPAAIPWKSHSTTATTDYTPTILQAGPYGGGQKVCGMRTVAIIDAADALYYYRFVKSGEPTQFNAFVTEGSWQVFSLYVKNDLNSATDEIQLGFYDSTSSAWRARVKWTFSGATMTLAGTITAGTADVVRSASTDLGFGWYRIEVAYKTEAAAANHQRRAAAYFALATAALDKRVLVHGAMLEEPFGTTRASRYFVPAHEAFRCDTVADTTFVLNTTKSTALDTSKLSASAAAVEEFYLWVRRVNYDTAYVVRLKSGNAKCKVATLTANTAVGSAATVDPSSNGAANGPRRCVGYHPGNPITTFGVDELCECGAASSLQDYKKGIFFKAGVDTNTGGAYRVQDITTEAVANDLAFKSNPANPTNPTPFIGPAVYSYQSGNKLGDGAGGSSAANNGCGNQGLKHFLTVDDALKPFDLTTIDWPSRATNDVQVAGSVIRVTSATAMDEVLVEDSTGGDSLILCRKEVESAADLPPYAVPGFIVRVKGSNDSELDDYFAKAVALDGTSTGFTKVKWVEALDYDEPLRFDASRMPHTLTRKIDTAGAKTGFVGRRYLEFNRAAWTEKAAGDATLAPSPSFVGVTINALEFDRGRMHLYAGQREIASQTNVYYNFWRTTVRRLDDDDAYDIDSAHGTVPVLRDALAIGDKLLSRSELTLFETIGDPTLTPRTAHLRAREELPTIASCPMVASGQSVYLPAVSGAFTLIYESIPSEEGTRFSTRNITEAVENYIAGTPIQLAASEQVSVLAVLADGNQRHVYVNRTLVTPEGRRPCWWRYDLGAGAKIAGICFIRNSLYFLILRTWELVLERMTIAQGLEDAGYGWLCHLDRRVSDVTPGVTKTYAAGPAETTITLPWLKDTGATLVVAKRSDGTSIAITSESTFGVGGVSVTRCVVAGDQTAVDTFEGQTFDASYEASKHAIRDDAGKIVGSNPHFRVKNAYLAYNKSAKFRVQVIRRGQSADTMSFVAPKTTSTAQTAATSTAPAMDRGVLQVPVADDADQVRVLILNDGHFPARFSKMEFEGEYALEGRKL